MTTPSNLNQPTAGLQVANQDGTIHKLFMAWLAALTTVANWTVTGALKAASLSGATLALSTRLAAPANGQIGFGDAGWIKVGSGGNIPGTSTPVPGFLNGWGNVSPSSNVARFRLLADGLVLVEGQINGGANGQPAFNFPAGYQLVTGDGYSYLGDDLTTNGAIAVQVAGGSPTQLVPIAGTGDGVDIHTSFYAEQ